MSDIVIDIIDLSKRYQLGTISTGSLSRDISSAWARVRGKEDPNSLVSDNDLHTINGKEFVWAIKDINLQVEKGEILGVIGKNGAGKSTLLKILSRITSPTSGEVKIKGRVASLLEVGTGFHPELTGHENIYLNGVILGMTKQEIDCKLEEIIDFSGIEKYIETPVKRYSSGMRVRLAFSVAAHLDADILLIDEVLAVGDLDFQQKSINYLENEGKNKKTVLFVSHKLRHIEQLTERTILLSNGCIELDSHTDETVEYYKNKFINIKEGDQFIPQTEYNNQFKIIGLNLYNSENEKKNSFIKGENFKICCEIIISNTKINKFSILLTISDGNNNEISGTKTEMKDINKGTYIFEFIEDKIRYNWGDYFISLHIFSGHNCIAEFNRIGRISFINKLIQSEVHYGGYLLNQMKTKINIVE